MTKAPTKSMLGPVPVTEGSEAPSRMVIFLWGAAACGKTTFAATAPGNKLWLAFGDQEHVSVMRRKDVRVAKLYEMTVADMFKHAKNENPFNLDTYLSEHEDIETVVVDSATALTYLALQHAIDDKIGAGRGFIPTIEAPGQSAYGARNAIVLKVLTGLLRVTAKHGVHLVITAHESDPTNRNENGKEIIDYISVMLGGQIVNNISLRLSEIWYFSQAPHGNHERKIAIRPTRLRRPMKTRMFSNKGEPEFILDYDADLPDKGQMTIASWYDQWYKSGGEKVPVPQSRVSHTKKK